MTIFDDNYPELLKNIHLPPTILYCKGSLFLKNEIDLNAHTISFVGPRDTNNYGIQAVRLLVPPVCQSGFSIISGGALGVDTAVHQSTLEVAGRTIVVIGSGLLKPYPAVNQKLFEKISNNNGLLISSFPLNAQAHPGNFPARNRIISGLSQAVVVVQASEKSGALITARYALEQSRTVFVVPGPITDALSLGSNKLIAQGAFVVTCPNDIMDASLIFQIYL